MALFEPHAHRIFAQALRNQIGPKSHGPRQGLCGVEYLPRIPPHLKSRASRHILMQSPRKCPPPAVWPKGPADHPVLYERYDSGGDFADYTSFLSPVFVSAGRVIGKATILNGSQSGTPMMAATTRSASGGRNWTRSKAGCNGAKSSGASTITGSRSSKRRR